VLFSEGLRRVKDMFCKHCGIKLLTGAGFCSSCGAKTEAGEAVPAPQTLSPRTVAQPPRKHKFVDLLMIPVAIILVLFGIGNTALTVVGSTTTAKVTDYEQVMFVNNDNSSRNPSRYKLEYQFSVNGERFTGSVTRVFSGGSHMRQTLQVRYLPFWPHVNAEYGGMPGPAGLIMIGVGVVALVFWVKKKYRLRNESR
jgi:hypothetical protein